jgi:hypothetical protein
MSALIGSASGAENASLPMGSVNLIRTNALSLSLFHHGEGRKVMPASYSHNWSILKAWKDWKIAHLSFGDSDVCSEYELKRIANYMGIPAAQLRWVSSYGPDPISLLERRMKALSLNPDDVAHIEPLTVRTLQQRCVKCEKSGQCALDLADELTHPGSQYWRDYCPNAATLSMLSTVQSCSKVYK